MTRFSVGGAGDEEEQLSSERCSRLVSWPGPKKPRTSFILSVESSKASAELASSSGICAPATASTSTVPRPTLDWQKLPFPGPFTVAEKSESKSGEDLGTSSSSDDMSSSAEDESESEEKRQQNQRNRDQVQLAEPRVVPAPVVIKANGAPVRECGGPITAIFTDPDVLDCPICLDPLSPPVYQCDNGHVACGSCCLKMRNKCGSCCMPIGYNRCRAIEKVLESVKVSCRNMQHGCAEKITCSKKLEHEKNCNFSPCSCPYLGCDFTGASKYLYTHFAGQHSGSSRRFLFNSIFFISLGDNQNEVFLQERNENILFVLNRSSETLGSLVNVVCMAPSSSKKRFFYNISVKDEDSSIMMTSFSESVPKWVAHPPTRRYLLVPSDYFGSNRQLWLGIVICKDK